MTVASENSCNVSLWEGCSPAAGCRGGAAQAGGGEDIAAPRRQGTGGPERDCLEPTGTLATSFLVRFTKILGQEG